MEEEKQEHETRLENALIESYGEQIISDLEIIKDKIGVIIASHIYAGTIGNNPMCIINRELKKLI